VPLIFSDNCVPSHQLTLLYSAVHSAILPNMRGGSGGSGVPCCGVKGELFLLVDIYYIIVRTYIPQIIHELVTSIGPPSFLACEAAKPPSFNLDQRLED
jgi:hypothetical protein